MSFPMTVAVAMAIMLATIINFAQPSSGGVILDPHLGKNKFQDPTPNFTVTGNSPLDVDEGPNDNQGKVIAYAIVSGISLLTTISILICRFKCCSPNTAGQMRPAQQNPVRRSTHYPLPQYDLVHGQRRNQRRNKRRNRPSISSPLPPSATGILQQDFNLREMEGARYSKVHSPNPRCPPKGVTISSPLFNKTSAV